MTTFLTDGGPISFKEEDIGDYKHRIQEGRRAFLREYIRRASRHFSPDDRWGITLQVSGQHVKKRFGCYIDHTFDPSLFEHYSHEKPKGFVSESPEHDAVTWDAMESSGLLPYNVLLKTNPRKEFVTSWSMTHDRQELCLKYCFMAFDFDKSPIGRDQLVRWFDEAGLPPWAIIHTSPPPGNSKRHGGFHVWVELERPADNHQEFKWFVQAATRQLLDAAGQEVLAILREANRKTTDEENLLETLDQSAIIGNNSRLINTRPLDKDKRKAGSTERYVDRWGYVHAAFLCHLDEAAPACRVSKRNYVNKVGILVRDNGTIQHIELRPRAWSLTRSIREDEASIRELFTGNLGKEPVYRMQGEDLYRGDCPSCEGKISAWYRLGSGVLWCHKDKCSLNKKFGQGKRIRGDKDDRAPRCVFPNLLASENEDHPLEESGLGAPPIHHIFHRASSGMHPAVLKTDESVREWFKNPVEGKRMFVVAAGTGCGKDTAVGTSLLEDQKERLVKYRELLRRTEEAKAEIVTSLRAGIRLSKEHEDKLTRKMGELIMLDTEGNRLLAATRLEAKDLFYAEYRSLYSPFYWFAPNVNHLKEKAENFLSKERDITPSFRLYASPGTFNAKNGFGDLSPTNPFGSADYSCRNPYVLNVLKPLGVPMNKECAQCEFAATCKVKDGELTIGDESVPKELQIKLMSHARINLREFLTGARMIIDESMDIYDFHHLPLKDLGEEASRCYDYQDKSFGPEHSKFFLTTRKILTSLLGIFTKDIRRQAGRGSVDMAILRRRIPKAELAELEAILSDAESLKRLEEPCLISPHKYKQYIAEEKIEQYLDRYRKVNSFKKRMLIITKAIVAGEPDVVFLSWGRNATKASIHIYNSKFQENKMTADVLFTDATAYLKYEEFFCEADRYDYDINMRHIEAAEQADRILISSENAGSRKKLFGKPEAPRVDIAANLMTQAFDEALAWWGEQRELPKVVVLAHKALLSPREDKALNLKQCVGSYADRFEYVDFFNSEAAKGLNRFQHHDVLIQIGHVSMNKDFVASSINALRSGLNVSDYELRSRSNQDYVVQNEGRLRATVAKCMNNQRKLFVLCAPDVPEHWMRRDKDGEFINKWREVRERAIITKPVGHPVGDELP